MVADAADQAKLTALASEIAPKVREARRMAVVSRSMSNMRQIGMAVKMYVNEYTRDMGAEGRRALETLFAKGGSSFRKVALAEFPAGMWSVVFLSQAPSAEVAKVSLA